MDFVCDIASGLVIEVGKLLCRHVGQPIRHMYKFKSNVQKLQEQKKKLTEKKESVLRDVEEARRREDIIIAEVQEWLNKVGEFTKRLDSVTDQEDKQCFKCCPNLKTRFVDSKEADKLVKECGPLLRQGDFPSVYSKNHARELKQREKELTEKYEGVRHRVEEAERQGDTIEAEVQGWLAKVEDFTTRVKNITNEENKEAAELVKECDRLPALGNFPRVSYHCLPRRTESMYVKKDYAFDSRESVFNEVMEALKNYNIKVIGLHGMGGVGKTTLVRKVYWQLTEVNRLFDQVAMAEVSQNPDRIKVQGAIADSLGLKLQGETLDTRASQLHQWLKEKKSVLIILDDVWKELDLKAIGIPFGNADQRHCRILVTSRDQDVCTVMKSEKYINVEPLSYDEARILFWKTVDDDAKQSKFEPIAESIVKNCDGLPVAILAIAKTLKGSNDFLWNKVSKELGNFKCSAVVHDFHPVLKLSYDYMENEEAKLLFLLFGLHEVGHPVLIDHLVRCVIGLGFLQFVTTMKAARDEVDQLIKELKNANLLLDSDRKDMVKMHDVIHVVAQKIASKEHKMKMFNIQGGVYLNEELEKDIYKDSTAISLHLREVPMLLGKLNFPQLKLLLLHSQSKCEPKHGYRSYLKIPDIFLDGMRELRVLVLNGVCLRSFIPSLNYESNIRTLSLEDSILLNITKVGMLKKLEVLSFSGPNVKRLPEEIRDLTRLKLLDLDSCFNLEVIPPNVISKLTRLEELYVCYNFVNWDTPGNASLVELKQLHDLTILCMHIMNAPIIPQDFFPENLERFRIIVDRFDEAVAGSMSETFGDAVVGSMSDSEGEFDTFDPARESYISFQTGESDRSDAEGVDILDELRKQFGERKMLLRNTNDLQCGVEKFLQKTEVLFLYGIDGIKNVHPDLGGKGFPDLKHLRIDDNRDILHIIKHEENDCYRPFHMLESLFLHNLDNLEKLRHGDSREEPFKMLKVIDVCKCAELTQLISSSMTHLEEIKVTDCENLKEIFGNDVPDSSITISEIVFTELHTLTLDDLPKLMNFGPTAILRTPKIIEEGDHEDLKSLFDNKVSFPSLKNLTLSSLNIPNIWCNQLPSSYSFGETLTSLDVEHCHHLKFLFSSSMVNGLQQLKKLNVAVCESMEVIINKEGSSGENNFNSISFFEEKVCNSLKEILDVPEGSSSKAVIMFPKLTELRLRYLPNLKSFYNGLHIPEWPSLKELRVDSCNKVEIFGSEYQSLCEVKQSDPRTLFIVDKAAFPRLEDLILMENDNLKEIWHGGGIISKKLFFEGKTNIIKFPHYLLASDTLEVSSGYFKQIGGGSDDTFMAALRELRTLRVDDMWKKSSETSDSLECLVSSWVSFENLTNLKITTYHSGFKYLLTYSTVTSLQNLTQLEISSCNTIEAVIMPPTDEVNDKIVFNQLKCLELEHLESLTSFYSGNHTLEFPSLEQMIVDSCPKMKVFSEGDSIIPMLRSIQIEKYYAGDDDRWRWEGDLNNTIQKIFKEMVAFRRFVYLPLSEYPWLKEVWRDQVSFNSFCGLETLTVEKCADMSSAIPLHLLPWLESLYRLTIKDCDSLEEVIDVEGLDVDYESVLLPELTHFELIELPRLRNVWSKHHLEILGFTNLKHLSISKCNNLQYIFTTNIIFSLEQLEKVEIRDCAMVETIITEDREKDAALSDIIVPSLKFIIMEALPKLTCFHLGSSVLECSSLKTMTINDCPQMKTFVFTFTKDHDVQDIPLFNEKVAFPKLKKLKLSKLPMVEHLWRELCRAFQCLKTVEISECVNLQYIFTTNIILGLKQLEEVEIRDCAMVETIITEDKEKDAAMSDIIVPSLKFIIMESLPKLTCFHLGSSVLECSSLKTMTINDCPQMKTFVLTFTEDHDVQDIPLFNEKVAFPKLKKLKLSKLPMVEHLWRESCRAFQCLETVEILECVNLQYIFTTNIILDLKKLEDVEIRDCAKVETIITEDREKDAAISNIVVPWLVFISLESLPKVTCFHLGSSVLECSSLKTMTINDCPQMKTFVFTSTEDHDLQDTPFFNEKVAFPKLKKLKLSKLPMVEHLWRESCRAFQCLKTIEISECVNLQYIFTTNIILGLKKLKEVEIRDCAMVETIITEDGENDAAMSDIIVPSLKFIIMESLPKLTCFHLGSSVLECSSLKTMSINDRPQMKTFVFTSAEDHDLQDTPLFSEKVAFPNLKKLKLSKLPMVKHLGNESCRAFQGLETIEISECVNLKSLVPSSASLQSLQSLEVSQCDGLTSLVTLSTAKSLGELFSINVVDCKNMQEIVTHIHTEDEKNDGVVFGWLYRIELHCLPNIAGFYLGDCTIEFPFLENVVVSQCQKMNTFSKGVVSTPNLTAVQRTYDEEKGRWKKDINTTIQLLFEETNV